MFNIVILAITVKLFLSKYQLHKISLFTSSIISLLFAKLPRLGDGEVTLRSSSQPATCLPHTVQDSHGLFNTERQIGKL